MAVAPNTQTMRTVIVATRTARQMTVSSVVENSSSCAARTTCATCSPISRKTAFSRTNCTVAQLVCSDSRDAADCSTGDLWPSSNPVTTTASTPLAWMASAGRYARKGATRDSVVSRTGSCTRFLAAPRITATPTPTSTPPPAARAKSPRTVQTVTVAVVAIAAAAVRSATRAVASLSRLSPSRIDTIRRGMPTRRAIVVAATASGGATTAPRAKPAISGTPGTIAVTTRPTSTAVKMTAPTARIPIA